MNRKVYCDYLRIIATFAVVIIHVAATKWTGVDVNSNLWKNINFINSIFRWCIPIFVMISGTLFLGKDISLKKLYSKYILRMVLAFFFWSSFYVFNAPGGIKNGIRHIIGGILKGHYHMWYIIMIIGIYMCIPFFNKIVSEEKITKYFLLVSFGLAYLIPWGLHVISDTIATKYEFLNKLVEIVDNNVSTMELNMVMGYSFYFVLGYYLDRVKINKKIRLFIYCMGIIGCIFTVGMDNILALRLQLPCGRYYGAFNVNIVFESLALFVLFKNQNFKNDRMTKIAKLLSKYSFGAYLIHDYFKEKLLFGHFNDIGSIEEKNMIILVSVIVFILSYCASAILNHIPIIKKYCV